MNQSTAFLAAEAFLIATGLVAFSGITFTWTVKTTTLGVESVFLFLFSLSFPFYLFVF